MDIDPNNNNNANINSYAPSLTTAAYPTTSFAGYNNPSVYSGQNVALTAVPHQQQPSFTPLSPQSPPPSFPSQSQQPTPIFGVIIPGCPVRTDFVPIIDSSNPTLPVTKYSLTLSCSTDLHNIPLLSITELVLFVTSAAPAVAAAVPAATVPIPPEYGVLCYWQITESPKVPPINVVPITNTPSPPETTGFALFGALTHSQPSAIYRTGWSEHEQLVSMVQKISSVLPSSTDLMLTIGLSIEPIQNVQNILGGSSISAIASTTLLMTSPLSTPNTMSDDVGGIMNQTINSQTTQSRLMVAQKIALDLFHFMQSFDTPQGTSNNNNMMMVPTNIFDRWYQRFENRYRRDPNFFLKKSD
jgi:hypothetical protein